MSNTPINIPKSKNPENVLDTFEAFIELIRILRAECPWDKKQTNKSISQLLIEETYEMIEAIDEENDLEFSKELGDVLLHVVMHSVIAEQREAFNLNEVITRVHNKLVHRHPHVFGETQVDGADQVVQNWEQLKKKEGRKSTLEGVPKNLPALLRAERIQMKASRVGFDWDNKQDVWEKVFEEISELRVEKEKGDKDKFATEFGDLMFALVNAARHEGIIAEESLQKASNKFTKRFEYIEEQTQAQGKQLDQMSLEEMDKLWDEAKEKGL